MEAFALVPFACWLCVLVATLHRPYQGNEVAELVYVRLLGRQQLLMTFAAVTDLVLLAGVLSLPAQVNRDLHRFREPCEPLADAREQCFVYENGKWEIATPTPPRPGHNDLPYALPEEQRRGC